MEDLGFREPFPRQAMHPLPSPFAPFLAASPKDTKPQALDLGSERVEGGDVSGDRVVVEPPLDHGAKPAADFNHRVVHVLA